MRQPGEPAAGVDGIDGVARAGDAVVGRVDVADAGEHLIVAPVVDGAHGDLDGAVDRRRPRRQLAVEDVDAAGHRRHLEVGVAAEQLVVEEAQPDDRRERDRILERRPHADDAVARGERGEHQLVHVVGLVPVEQVVQRHRQRRA